MRYHYITLTLTAVMGLGSLLPSVHADDSHLSAQRNIEHSYSSVSSYPKRQGGQYPGSVIFRGEIDEDENEADEDEPDENEYNKHGTAIYSGSRTPTTFGHSSTHGRFPKRQGGQYTGGVIFRGEPDEDENEADEDEPDENEYNKHGAAIYSGSRTPTTFGHSSTHGRFPKRQVGQYPGSVIFRGEPDEDENEPDEEEPDEDEPNEHGSIIYYGAPVPAASRHSSAHGEFANSQGGGSTGNSFRGELGGNKNEPNKDKSLIYGRFRRFNA
ncbi:hypothetical protein INT45_003930 [Circinella minor]|uniref:Uncharacterized protein n=1 Tax=Circinella minor TaxID=1195481 RepID=A0A8H7VLJ0_9FUNG|nr:hypothetical protein INT45_003930 [Circinella minor]